MLTEFDGVGPTGVVDIVSYSRSDGVAYRNCWRLGRSDLRPALASADRKQGHAASHLGRRNQLRISSIPPVPPIRLIK